MELPEFEVKFKAGAKKPSKARLMVVGIILGVLVDILIKFFKVSSTTMWGVIDEIGREFGIEDINQLILQNSKLLDERIQRDVDKAIKDYETVVELESVELAEPIWFDEQDGETALGGTLGFTYDFVEEEPKDEQG